MTEIKCSTCGKKIEIVVEGKKEVAYCDCIGYSRAVYTKDIPRQDKQPEKEATK